MAKIERDDDCIGWYHVMNRGLAHRTVIENRTDARFFLALLARIVRRDLLEVHAFSLMSNHFHLLVRCQDGKLSESLSNIDPSRYTESQLEQLEFLLLIGAGRIANPDLPAAGEIKAGEAA